MSYDQYALNLIESTGARNFHEACIIKKIRENYPTCLTLSEKGVLC